MKWLLYIMLFVTPAANLTDAEKASRSVLEAKRIWTLQSTSTMEFSSFDACYSVQDELLQSVSQVATMTMRTWCFCDSADALCPDKQTVSEKIKTLRQTKKLELDKKNQTSQQIPEPKNFTIERLYPPERK